MTTLAEVNGAMAAEFAQLLDGIYEHSPWIVENAASRRPFATHPELAGKAMVERSLTASSTDEQTRAGLTACTPEEMARIAELNAAYQKKFGFPFILAVRGPRGLGLRKAEMYDQSANVVSHRLK